ncbi:acyltransferase [Pseudomonas sp. SD17-1]|jgi:peptidoglycan/LPS O-acetylase OafA/YrhL|uniref:acyltransferase family protein n=1 Tax=Pseudomonas TaxID=286 RepID=UPI000998CEBB|nr:MULTISPECIES: acyltransferase family protein [Pseudomonas]MBG8559714.1 acyltransferase [Pseudomonas qingdaonensis]OOW06550.1 acyltransferase [Pseudomonas sp. MF6396]WEJ20083.1 acyltransferase [Pseudomonas sp. SD17-1]
MSNPNIQYRPDIDGLRAIAVLAVVVFHAFPSALPGGFVGVDFFFVISGYLIGGILLKSIANGTFSFSDFYARRVKRIFPALLTVLASCYVFGWFGLFADEFEQLGKHIAGGAAFVSNIVLLNESGYFDNSAETKPLLHLWSLGVEEQFYFLWPIILWAAWKLRANILAVSVLLFAVSFTLNISMIKGDPVTIFYSPHTRFWEIIAGAILAYLSIFRNLQPRFYAANLLSLAGTALVAYGIATISKENSFPGWFALIPVAAAIFLISAGPNAFFNKHVLASRPMVWVGLISFPLYLWHWPLLSLLRVVEGGTPSIELRLIAVVTAVILAATTFYFIEKPLRSKTNWTFKTHALTAAMAVTLCIGLSTFYYSGIPNRSTVKTYKDINSQFVGPHWEFSKNRTCLNRYDFREATTYDWWFCVTNKDAPPTIIIMGNSFANHIYPGLESLAEFKNETILSIGACDPTLADTQPSDSPKTGRPCAGFRPLHQMEYIKKIISESPNLKYVLISGLSGSPTEQYISSIKEKVSYIERSGAKAIIFFPHIVLPYDIKGCFSRPFTAPKNECTKPASDLQRLKSSFSQLVVEVKASNPMTMFYDQNEFFCDAERCNFIVDGMPVFRDEYNHYSEYASKKLAEHFALWAKKNAPEIIQ